MIEKKPLSPFCSRSKLRKIDRISVGQLWKRKFKQVELIVNIHCNVFPRKDIWKLSQWLYETLAAIKVQPVLRRWPIFAAVQQSQNGSWEIVQFSKRWKYHEELTNVDVLHAMGSTKEVGKSGTNREIDKV